ncbi:MAG: phage terminase large subunit [Phycisphaerales bacterium]
MINPFRPLPWQRRALTDLSPVLLATGSAGGGKSRFAAEKLHAFCKRYPGAIALAMRKTKESMINSVVLFLKQDVIGDDPQVRHQLTKSRFEYANGSMLIYRGMADEKQREQVRSINVDIAWMEEANKFLENDYNEVLARMRGRAAPWTQVILSTNPDAYLHWINQRLILGKEASAHYSGAGDNPYNPESYMHNLDLLTGALGRRLRDGEWVQAEGLVYDGFDRDNISEEADYDAERGLWELAYDDGYVDPRAMLFIQRTGRTVYVFDEIYHSKHLPDVCIEEMLGKGYGRPDIAIGDPSARELKERFRQADVVARAGKVPIVEGIQVVRRLIRDGQGMVSLLVHPRCKNLIQEMTEGYKYPEGSRRDNEQPIDEANHACDALRYWAWMRAR